MSTSFADTGVPPRPPPELVARVGGRYEDLEEIAAAHRRVIDELLPDDFDYAGKAILDFGCGVGRTMTTFHGEAGETEVFGCDIHIPSIDWASSTMSPPFTFFACREEPPLDQPDERFDLVYACSVFTHLTDSWARWLVELQRVLKPRGVLIASVLNRPMSLPVFGREWDERTGMAPAFLGRQWDLGGPCVAHSEWWVREHWGRAFEIERFEEGVAQGGSLVGHGWVMGRPRENRPTAADLQAVDPDDRRERAALEYNLEILSAEAREAGERAGRAEAECEELRAEIERLGARIREMEASRAWRLTAPLRRTPPSSTG
jgi:SAM-dependent methyltransferase